MNHPILSFFLTFAAIASLSAADLKLGLDNWYGNPLAWKETPNGFQTVTSGGGLRYTPAPLSENCEISAVVTADSRQQTAFHRTSPEVQRRMARQRQSAGNRQPCHR